jgi:thymidine phosphorylase
MNLLDLIYKKREGQNLSAQEINTWIQSLSTKKSPPLYQVSSLLAFIYQKGMTPDEITALTNAIRYSGVQFQYKGFPRSARFVDKHSTGGVGDKITYCNFRACIACNCKTQILSRIYGT